MENIALECAEMARRMRSQPGPSDEEVRQLFLRVVQQWTTEARISSIRSALSDPFGTHLLRCLDGVLACHGEFRSFPGGLIAHQ